jgi:hypothetical protein
MNVNGENMIFEGKLTGYFAGFPIVQISIEPKSGVLLAVLGTERTTASDEDLEVVTKEMMTLGALLGIDPKDIIVKKARFR